MAYEYDFFLCVRVTLIFIYDCGVKKCTTIRSGAHLFFYWKPGTFVYIIKMVALMKYWWGAASIPYPPFDSHSVDALVAEPQLTGTLRHTSKTFYPDKRRSICYFIIIKRKIQSRVCATELLYAIFTKRNRCVFQLWLMVVDMFSLCKLNYRINRHTRSDTFNFCFIFHCESRASNRLRRIRISVRSVRFQFFLSNPFTRSFDFFLYLYFTV